MPQRGSGPTTPTGQVRLTIAELTRAKIWLQMHGASDADAQALGYYLRVLRAYHEQSN